MLSVNFKVSNLFYWILLALVVLFFYKVIDIVSLFFLGFLIAYIINVLALQLNKAGISIKLARIFALLLLILCGGILINFVAPPFFNQLTQIKTNLVSYFVDIRREGLKVSSRELTEHMSYEQKTDIYIRQMVSGFSVKYPLMIKTLGGKDNVVKFLIGKQQQIVAAIVSFVSDFSYRALQFLSQIFNLVVLPILVLYFLFAFDSFRAKTLRLFDVIGKRSFLEPVFEDINTMLESYLKSQITVMLAMGIATTLVATVISFLFGTSYALFIGCFAGVMCVIPYIGFLLICVVSALIAFTTASSSPVLAALVMIILLLAVNAVFDNVISPRIVGDSVGLHPLFTIFALLSFGKLWGFMGMILAVPCAATIKIVLFKLFPGLATEDLPYRAPSSKPKKERASALQPVLRIPPLSHKNSSPFTIREKAHEKNNTVHTKSFVKPLKNPVRKSLTVPEVLPSEVNSQKHNANDREEQKTTSVSPKKRRRRPSWQRKKNTLQSTGEEL